MYVVSYFQKELSLTDCFNAFNNFNHFQNGFCRNPAFIVSAVQPRTLVGLFNRLGCNRPCHGDADTPQGPSLNGLANSKRYFTDGSSAIADDGYLRESIINPFQKITKGYSNTMSPDYKSLTEEQIRVLVEYMKSIGVSPSTTSAPKPTGNVMDNPTGGTQ